MKQFSDEQLLALSRSGDKEAFSKLLRRYEKELFNFLVKFLGQRSLAEDVFQESFLQVYVSAADFDVSRRFRPWLYTIAANKARDALRKRARRPVVQLTASDGEGGEVDLWHNLLKDETTPEKLYDMKQREQQVRRAVAELPEYLREILILAYFNQLSYKELAEVFNIPLGTVKSRLHSAVAAFAKKYREKEKKEF